MSNNKNKPKTQHAGTLYRIKFYVVDLSRAGLT